MTAATTAVAPDLWLDSRRALCHSGQGWLAIADLHLGYALERRRRGGLFPDYGDEEAIERLLALLADHRPRTLIIAGDLVDGGAAPGPGLELLHELATRPRLEVLLLQGNHDRALARHLDSPLPNHFRSGSFVFHHGDPAGLRAALPDLRRLGAAAIEVCGHIHPAARLNDGAGTRLKLPALWSCPPAGETIGQPARTWRTLVLPAFSSWAAGASPDQFGHTAMPRPESVWACAPNLAFQVPLTGRAPASNQTPSPHEPRSREPRTN